MEFFIILIGLIWGILNLILFFKIWGATNDIAEMKDMMRNIIFSPSNIKEIPAAHSADIQDDVATTEVTEKVQMSSFNIKPGDYIIRNMDNKEYKVKEVRHDGVLIYLGMVGGYRMLKPNEFTIKQ